MYGYGAARFARTSCNEIPADILHHQCTVNNGLVSVCDSRMLHFKVEQFHLVQFRVPKFPRPKPIFRFKRAFVTSLIDGERCVLVIESGVGNKVLTAALSDFNISRLLEARCPHRSSADRTSALVQSPQWMRRVVTSRQSFSPDWHKHK